MTKQSHVADLVILFPKKNEKLYHEHWGLESKCVHLKEKKRLCIQNMNGETVFKISVTVLHLFDIPPFKRWSLVSFF